MEEQREIEMFLNHPYFFDILTKRMIRTIRSPVEKFIFTYVFMLGHKQVEAAEVLVVHETDVSRHIKHIREILDAFGFANGYEDNLAKCKERKCTKV